MRVIPYGSRIIVRRDSLPEKKGSIFIPKRWYQMPKDQEARSRGDRFERKRQPPQTGIVLACGLDCTEVNEGDHILFGKYAGTEHTMRRLDGTALETILLMRERDVWAILGE